MKFFCTALLSVILSMPVAQGKPCSEGGGECVSYFHGSDCDGANLISDYVPTCAGNCFQYNSFDSLSVQGGFLFGTDCHIYSDINCQNQIKDTGNVIDDISCVNVQGGPEHEMLLQLLRVRTE
ncbi:hypothetical protein MVEN_01837300 [Mycena venus]|uniref:Uncharacterized protein n=1 Tax=Mycena venus TaxID=2733690 RepID=A0A8H7CP79_9AGAR|nr:hypothetical protein MVEN_01837300 [Mycena venus]